MGFGLRSLVSCFAFGAHFGARGFFSCYGLSGAFWFFWDSYFSLLHSADSRLQVAPDGARTTPGLRKTRRKQKKKKKRKKERKKERSMRKGPHHNNKKVEMQLVVSVGRNLQYTNCFCSGQKSLVHELSTN